MWASAILLPWPKKLRQSRTSNNRRMHAREITRLCPLALGCPNFFGQGSTNITLNQKRFPKISSVWQKKNNCMARVNCWVLPGGHELHGRPYRKFRFRLLRFKLVDKSVKLPSFGTQLTFVNFILIPSFPASLSLSLSLSTRTIFSLKVFLETKLCLCWGRENGDDDVTTSQEI